MANNNATKPRDIECQRELKAFERNRYFYGKLLTVRDFEVEQRYFIEKQRLINRLIHGSGVVCGLKVDKVDETKIKIDPGVALDCCGREIVVPTEKVIDLKEQISLEGSGTVYVLLKYDWCGKEPVPNVSDVSSCEETCCYSRIMESYKIEISQEMPEVCLPSDEGICKAWAERSDQPMEFVQYWTDTCPGFSEEPSVVLASITFENGSIKGIDNAIVDEEEGFKKQLVFSNPRLYELLQCVEREAEPGLEEDLTHITTIDWPHNGGMGRGEFITKISDGLKITFSKNISGLDENTFLVALKVPTRLLIAWRVPDIPTEPPLNFYQYEYIRGNIKRNGNWGAFYIGDPDAAGGLRSYLEKFLNILIANGLAPEIQVLIQIKCDFIKDVNGNAVAGHHFFGQGKSGLIVDGKHTIPGGLFESWFYLK